MKRSLVCGAGGFIAHTAAEMGVPRYFFSSSVCVYRDMQPGEVEMTEEQGSTGAGVLG